MPIAICTLCFRKEGMTAEEFKDYFEKKHVPLLLGFIGDAAPISYRRNYLNRDATGSPAVLWGDKEKANWDCFSEVLFSDQEHLNRFTAAYTANREAIVADEAQFFDHSKIIVSLYTTEGN